MKSHAFHVEQTVPPPSACRKHAPLCAYRCHSKSPGVTLTRGHSRRRSVVSATPCSPSGTCTGYTHTQAHSSRHRLEEGNGVGQQFHIPDTCTLAHSHASHGWTWIMEMRGCTPLSQKHRNPYLTWTCSCMHWILAVTRSSVTVTTVLETIRSSIEC